VPDVVGGGVVVDLPAPTPAPFVSVRA